jgi:hypothetical protein
MSSTGALIKVMLRNRLYALFGTRGSDRKPVSKKSMIIRTILLLVLLFALMLLSLYTVANPLGKLSRTADVLEPVSTLITPATTMMVAVLTIPMIFSIFFQANDNATWLPYPFTATQIFTARLISAIISVYYIEFISIIPFAFAYSLGARLDAFAIIGQIIYILALPLIPIAILFMLGSLLAKIVNINKHKTVFNVIFILIIITFTAALIVGMSFGGSVVGETTEIVNGGEGAEEALQAFRDNVISSAQSLAWTRFFTYFSSPIFVGGWQGLVYPLIYTAISVLFVFCAVLLAKYSYLKVIQADSGGKKKSAKDKKNKLKIPKSPFNALVWRDMKNILRSTTYFMNLIFPALIQVVVLIIPILIPMFVPQESDYTTTSVFDYLYDPNNGVALFIFLGAATLFTQFTPISVTSFSREGEQVGSLKVLPVSKKSLFISKLFPGVIITSIIYFLTSTIVYLLALRQFYLYLIYLVAGLILIVLGNVIYLLYDLTHPYLNWTQEIYAVKQNKNILMSYLMWIPISLVLVGFGFLVGMLKINVYYSLLIYLGLVLITVLIIHLIIRKRKYTLFDRLS